MGGKAQTLQRHILGRFGDASLDCFRIFKFWPLGGDEAKHNLLITGNLSQWREVTGTVVVELPDELEMLHERMIVSVELAGHCGGIGWSDFVMEGNLATSTIVTIVTTGHPIRPDLREKVTQYSLPVTIGRDVWLGANVTVLPGVTIGDNSVIGACSLVTKDIPANVVAFGQPCKVYREIGEHDDVYYWRDRMINPSYDQKQ